VAEQEREELNRAEQLAARARELAARAEQVSQQAAGAAESEDQLAQLERELADLDEEERKLDVEFADLLAEKGPRNEADDAPREREERFTGWADRFTERMETLGDRFAEALTGAFAATPFGASDKVERDMPVDGTLPVSVDSFAGKVVVHAGEDDRVHVVAERHGRTESDRDSIVVDVERGDDGVKIRCHTSRLARHRWVNLDVTVPKASPTTIKTLGGAIQVDGTGGSVTAETQGGAIKVNGAVGFATVETLGGSISVTEHDGAVTAHTKGGSVRLSGALNGGVEAETMGGSVRIDGVDGSVRARTVGGSVHVSGRFSGECSLSTAGGSVTAGLATGSNVTVDAKGNSSSTDVTGLHASRGRIEGTVGEASGGSLSLRTSGGSVRVQQI
jgi:hypothetical protein